MNGAGKGLVPWKPAPAAEPTYSRFRINGDGGAGGQSAWIVPSHDLGIVRLGKYRGEEAGEAARPRGTALLMQIVPASR